MSEETQSVMGFDATGIAPEILSVLTRIGLTSPTPIQEQAIPVALQGGDVIGIAQTGTGKTLAFALPAIDQLLKKPGKILVMVPTRELAIQVEESIRKVTGRLSRPIRTVCLIGGMPMHRQVRDLRDRPSIIIGTPGRLRDHLEQKTLNISDVTILVLDEADRMLDMGFEPQIRFICSATPENRQTMLFSATMEPEIAALASRYQHNPVRIEVSKAGSDNAQISQQMVYVSHDGKLDILDKLLQEHQGTVLVFSRTKHGATKLVQKVQAMGHTATDIHSNKSLSQRRQALDGFKKGKYRVLIATDVASRGIDVKDIELVINYDLPDSSADYVHRIGRTGRAGKEGIAISLATFDQQRDVKAIERLVNKSIPLSPHSLEVPQARVQRQSTGWQSSGFQSSSGNQWMSRSGGPKRKFSSARRSR